MDIESLITNYKPSRESVELLRRNQLIIFAGTAGAGKNTIMNELLKTGKYRDIVTSTTRAPRDNDGVMEQDGVDYHFLTTEQAVEKLKAGDYLEVALVHGKINGVLVSEIDQAAQVGRTPIVDVNINGVHTLKSLSDKVIAIFVVPPSFDEWMKRIKRRYDSEEEFLQAWPIRRESAIRELEDALARPYYHFVVNDKLDSAVQSVEGIILNGDKFSEQDKGHRDWVEKIITELKNSTS